MKRIFTLMVIGLLLSLGAFAEELVAPHSTNMLLQIGRKLTVTLPAGSTGMVIRKNGQTVIDKTPLLESQTYTFGPYFPEMNIQIDSWTGSLSYSDAAYSDAAYSVSVSGGGAVDLSEPGPIGATTPSSASFAPAYTVTGSELIANGSFDGNADGWTLGGDTVYDTNKATITYTTDGDPTLVSSSFSLVAGHTYKVVFTVSGSNAPLAAYFNTNSGPRYQTDSYEDGTHSLLFTADATTTDYITFEDYNYEVGDTASISDVSIKEVTVESAALTVNNMAGITMFQAGLDLFENTALGIYSGVGVTTAVQNTSYGAYTLKLNATGNKNTAVGYIALKNSVSGDGNTAVGDRALTANTSGNSNVAVGSQALVQNTTGNVNTAIGNAAGYTLTTGNDNVLIGDTADVASGNQSDSIAIGANATVSADHTVQLGSATVTDGYVGTKKIGLVDASSTSHVVCWKAGPVLGYCSDLPGSDGTCTCN